MPEYLNCFLNLVIAFTHPEMVLEEYNETTMLNLTKIIPFDIKYKIYNKAENIRNANKYLIKNGGKLTKKNYTL